MELILFDSKKPDGITNQKIALHLIGEIITGENLASGNRPYFLIKQRMHLPTRSIRTNLVGPTTGSIGGVVVTPVVKGNTMWIRAVPPVQGNGVTTRVEAVHGGGSSCQGGAPRMLVVMLKEDSALPVNAAARSENQVVGRVVGIRGSQTVKNDIALVRLVVPVIVTEKKQIWPRGHQNPTIPKFKAQGIMNLGKLDHTIRFSISIIIR